MSGTSGRKTLAQRIDYLFRTVRPPHRREYTYEEVAQAVARDQRETISASYLWYLRTGQRDNPTLKHLTVLARFFGVPTAYFVDEPTGERVVAELALLAALQDAGVRDVALRAAGLSPASLETIGDMIARVRELEGLPPRRDD
ncbi:helix-turn-helix domain-containing protein [Saccharothrix violaceirubra]|uniref:Transcriptional regulator with XRE-family HTH domain n=1 Tax=Saccharothrix violaceirubra TaxID=413306 RepID=A0A7W7WYR9_9PSEU|nr:XRE family transcriptional regulator [Saccharothrix violaceirubra]MBB4968522.1 transcriptional regulator with XRE-family HTH domain [Saccharothrix violaceirubra]